MNEAEVKQTLLNLLKNIAPDTEPEKLGPDDKIRQILMIDSFDYLQFIVGVDEKFGIQTPEEDYSKIGTLKELLTYIQVKSKAASISDP